MKKILLIALLSICQFTFSQDKGTIKGKVTDKEMGGEALPFANIFIKNTSIGSTTDMDGNYNISVPAGNHILVFSFVGYETVEKPIVVVAGKTLIVNQEIGASQGVALDEVEIKGTVSKEKESALLLEQKKAAVIKESIGAEELSKKGVSDAAAAVTKISGVSKQEGSSNVYVRGLGDRYLNTTLNGLTLPSNDIEKKNIDLSLFPSDVIQNVSISKAYSPEFYGDFAAGNIDITSKEYRGNGMLEISLGAGINSRAFSENFVKSPGTGFAGFYGRYKHNPYAIVLGTNVDPVVGGAPINSSVGITGGKSFDINDNSRISVLGTLSFENDYSYKKGTLAQYSVNLIKLFPNVEEFEYKTRTTAMGNVLYKINDDNKLKFTSIFLNSSSDNVGYYGNEGKGFYYNLPGLGDETTYYQQNVQFNQDLIFVNQLTGEHKFEEGEHKLTWGIGYNRAYSHEPDRKRFTLLNYQYAFDNDPQTNPTFFRNSVLLDQQRYFEKIKDEELNSRINFGWKTSDQFTLNIGYNGRLKLRKFNNIRYGYEILDKNTPVSDVNNLNSIFNVANFKKLYNTDVYNALYPPKYSTLNLPGLNENTYNGELNIHAAYVTGIITTKDEKWSFVPGVRLENFDQRIDYNVINLNPLDPGFREGNNTFMLPSLNIKYSLTDEQNLRLSASKTISVPEFKEIAPYVYEGVGERVGGNQALLDNPSFSSVYNLDLKYEWFFSRDELLSLTVFGKQINDPINRVTANDATGTERYFRTGDKATVLGIEVEVRKNLIKNEDEETELSAGLNVAYMHTKQDLKSSGGFFSVTFPDFHSEDELQGASPILINADLNYSPTFGNFKPSGSLVFSYFSDRIDALGSGQIGNIIEKGIPTLDFILKGNITEKIQATISAKNLLDPSVERIRKAKTEDVVLSSYKKGMNISVGLNYKF